MDGGVLLLGSGRKYCPAVLAGVFQVGGEVRRDDNEGKGLPWKDSQQHWLGLVYMRALLNFPQGGVSYIWIEDRTNMHGR
jgi:hypothetical protein